MFTDTTDEKLILVDLVNTLGRSRKKLGQKKSGQETDSPPMSGPDSPVMNVMASSLNDVLFKQVYSRTISLIIIYF